MKPIRELVDELLNCNQDLPVYVGSGGGDGHRPVPLDHVAYSIRDGKVEYIILEGEG